MMQNKTLEDRDDGSDDPTDVTAPFLTSAERLGVLQDDGRIAVLSQRLTDDLGLDAPEDLRGLAVVSLWAHADRAAVYKAFNRARRGSTGLAIASLAYLSGQAAMAQVSFELAPQGRAVLMTLDWSETDQTRD